MKHGRLIDADALKEYFFRPYSNEESYSNIDIGHIIDDQPTVNSSAQTEIIVCAEQSEPHYDEWCDDCKEYDKERHCCPRWNKVIRETLKDAQPEPKWIPCSERLPEEYGEYICTMENGQVQECGFVPEKQKGLIKGWSTCEADGYKLLRNIDVLAWMPLPKPYKEDTE